MKAKVLELSRSMVLEQPNCSLKIEEEWLTTDEAAQYLKVTPAVLRNMTSAGKVPYCKLGRLNRYRVDELRKLLSSNRRGGFPWE